jgi:signal transduction histidine kinase
MNLVVNALKFSSPKGRVTLAARREGDFVRLDVGDAGIGVDPGDLPHIFTRGYSSERTANLGKNGGGLGLAVARAITMQHGGTLTCESQADHGATFSLRLPVRG